MKLIGSDRGLKQVEVNGKVIDRSRDGTFHVSGADAAVLRKSGDFGVSGTTFTGARGFRCVCGFVSVYRDHCGKCWATELSPE